MAPKQKASKKAEKNRQKQVIDDKTFGLKNKKKSKQVQKYVQQVEKTVKSGGQNQGRKPQVDKKAVKKAKAAAEAELNALLAQGLGAPKKNKQAGKKGAGDPVPVAVANKPKQEQQTIYIEETPTTLEDLIEEQREKWRRDGKSGTPVTEESLAKWKADKAERRRREARKKVADEQRKKGGGKGLSILSGRDLFEYKNELFVDDEDALAEEVTERIRDDEEENTAQNDSNLESKDEEKKEEEVPPLETTEIVLEDEGTQVAVAVQEQLYLEGDDEDLDDIVDSDEEGGV